MNDTSLNSLDQIRAFLTGTSAVEFSFATTTECYAWVEQTLVRFEYARLGKADKGLLRRYVQKVTDYSRAQLARLITRQRVSGHVQRQGSGRHRFARRYTPEDVRLLAHTDTLHSTLSGPATKKILEREYQVFGHAPFARLSIARKQQPLAGARRRLGRRVYFEARLVAETIELRAKWGTSHINCHVGTRVMCYTL